LRRGLLAFAPPGLDWTGDSSIKLADLFVQIAGDAKPLFGALGAVRAQLAALATLGRRTGASVLADVSGLELTAGIRSADALAARLRAATTAASNLNAQAGGLDRVFRHGRAPVVSDAGRLAEGFATASDELVRGVGQLGRLEPAAEGSARQAHKLAAGLSKLADDCMFLKQSVATDGIQLMARVLAGETRALERQSAALDAAADRHQAYRASLAQTGAELGRYETILDRVRPGGKIVAESSRDRKTGSAGSLGAADRFESGPQAAFSDLLGTVGSMRRMAEGLARIGDRVTEAIAPAPALGYQGQAGWISRDPPRRTEDRASNDVEGLCRRLQEGVLGRDNLAAAQTALNTAESNEHLRNIRAALQRLQIGSLAVATGPS
jgi:hypothetical protein